MPPNAIDVKNKDLLHANYNSLRIIFLILLGAQLMFLIICIVIVFTNNYHVSTVTKQVLNYLAPAIILFNFIIGSVIYSFRLKIKKKQPEFSDRIRKYVSQSVIRWAFFEGASFFVILAFLITRESVYLFSSVLVIAVYIFTVPVKKKYEKELKPYMDEDVNYQHRG